MLTAQQKKEWIDALRSGLYKQTRCELVNIKQDAFCCLGVACELFGNKNESRFDFDYGILPNLGNEIIRSKLVAMNDMQRKSFSQIADWIEENLPTREEEKVAKDANLS